MNDEIKEDFNKALRESILEEHKQELNGSESSTEILNTIDRDDSSMLQIKGKF